MIKLNTFILIIGVVVWISTYNLWQFFGLDSYYIGTAFMMFVAAYLIDSATCKYEKWDKFITKLFLLFALNNLADEIFFDPTKFSINEYLTILTYIIYLVWKNMKSSNG